MDVVAWLADQFKEPWLFPALLTIGAAALAARHTLRTNIREKSWQTVFDDKRRHLLEAVGLVEDLRHQMAIVGIILKTRNEPARVRYATLYSWFRYLCGSDPTKLQDPLERFVHDTLPEADEDFVEGPDLEERLAAARGGLLGILKQRMQSTNLELAKRRISLQMDASDPQVVFELCALGDEGLKHMSMLMKHGHPDERMFDDFMEKWRRRQVVLTDRLRDDLVRSTRSLAAATRRSRAWRRTVRTEGAAAKRDAAEKRSIDKVRTEVEANLVELEAKLHEKVPPAEPAPAMVAAPTAPARVTGKGGPQPASGTRRRR
jgi:hypothetical protein